MSHAFRYFSTGASEIYSPHMLSNENQPHLNGFKQEQDDDKTTTNHELLLVRQPLSHTMHKKYIILNSWYL
uniref:Uncharacterized protein n=1 Tax=Anguilla anguilla TaxID=7936 RepID=A0A0E9XNV4_ANGAN